MTIQNVKRLKQLAQQLSQTLVTATYLIDEIHSFVNFEYEPADAQAAASTESGGKRPVGRPSFDQATFSVVWQGKSVELGHTRSFWLLTRLARRPNQYVTHLDLLTEVWDDEELTTGTIRSTVCQLRRKLRSNGMPCLAAAIRGHNGHYMLAI